jgi:hypothetical protein
MTGTANGALSLIDRARREPEPSEFEQTLRSISTEALGMIVAFERDTILGLEKTRRPNKGGLGSEIPVGVQAQIDFHKFILGALRTEAEARDWGDRR